MKENAHSLTGSEVAQNEVLRSLLRSLHLWVFASGILHGLLALYFVGKIFVNGLESFSPLELCLMGSQIVTTILIFSLSNAFRRAGQPASHAQDLRHCVSAMRFFWKRLALIYITLFLLALFSSYITLRQIN